MTDIALIGQYSENNFNGCNCGIMDQFAVAMGKKDCAIFLDTGTLSYEYAPVELEDAKIIITNSKVNTVLLTLSTTRDVRNAAMRSLFFRKNWISTLLVIWTSIPLKIQRSDHRSCRAETCETRSL